MMRREIGVLVVGWLVASGFPGCSVSPGPTPGEGAATATRRATGAITERRLRDTIATFAGDAMEGRGPGTRGDRAARQYLVGRLRQVGCQPGMGAAGWEQPFALQGLETHLPDTWVFAGSDDTATVTLRVWDDYAGAAGRAESPFSIGPAPLVFVGYGIVAPEYGWDDFKDADLSGKVWLMLNDDPDWDPHLFAGPRKLYYGRWTYKFEMAAQRGAVAAIIIHTTPSAGYPWSVVQTSWNGVQFSLPSPETPSLGLQAWITKGAAQRLVHLGGHDLAELVTAARATDFSPVPLGVTTSLQLTVDATSIETANVAGVLPGSDPAVAGEVVVYSAHHDHLGVGPPDGRGDAIFNGALDNGAAVAQVLAIARAFSRLEASPRRSVLFLFPGAEEQGLLGSDYFVQHPPSWIQRLVANINLELGNIWGPTRDVTIYGGSKSTLARALADRARAQGRRTGPEKDLAAGWFYRSDQFSFARRGVPAIWFKSGTDYRGRPADWGRARQREWIERHYHQPSDQLTDSWDFRGLVEDAQLAFLLGYDVAQGAERPRYDAGDEFAVSR